MASGLRAGAFPAKVTVPVTVDAATATPGPTNTTSPAASHKLFAVTRMLSSLVIANLVSVDAGFSPSNGPDSTPGRTVGATLAQPRVKDSLEMFPLLTR